VGVQPEPTTHQYLFCEFDTFTRFKAMAARGNPQAGLSLLEKLDTLTKPETDGLK
jgi:hypothetical protein